MSKWFIQILRLETKFTKNEFYLMRTSVKPIPSSYSLLLIFVSSIYDHGAYESSSSSNLARNHICKQRGKLASTWETQVFLKSKVHHRSLNLFGCVISVPKLENRPFRSSNLFGCVIPVPKHRNHPLRSSNLFSCVIPVSKFVFEFHLGQNKVI